MKRLFVMIAHVGTSVLNPRGGVFAEPVEFEGSTPSELTRPGHDNPMNKILEDRVEHLCSLSEREREACSAELKSCARIIASARDSRPARLILIATDTPEGAFAAELHRRVFERLGAFDQVEILRPSGLQVRDAQTFRREGLPEYVRAVYQALETCPQDTYEWIFNPTGGFKGLVPYLTIMAMISGARMAYIFEWSDQLIELPAFPVTFDDDIVQQAMAPLAAAVTNDSVSQAEIEAAIGCPLRGSVFDPLFQHYDGDEYMASALGEILHARLGMRRDVHTSSAARADLAALTPDLQEHMRRQFAALADPSADSLAHGKYSANLSDLYCWGTGRSLHRILYAVRDRAVYVARVFPVKGSGHDDYEAALNARQFFFERFDDYEVVS